VAQAGGNILRSEIHKLIKTIWNKEDLPQQYKESITEPIYKNGVEIHHCYQLHTKCYPIFFFQG
jgi:hypothetical protein